MKKLIIVLLILISSCASDENTDYLNYVDNTSQPLVVPVFLENLSELNLFTDELNNLTPSEHAFEYYLNTSLFSDYAHKQRLIALPTGSSMEYIDDGFPFFPDNTLISKTFYYNNDERDLSLGKKIVETRILIKMNGVWELGNYIWNEEQTDAILDTSSTTTNVPLSYIDEDGNANDVSYVIPSSQECFDCHSNDNNITPIGPKLRSMNFNNQLENFISNNYLTNISDPSTITTLPNWEDENYTLEERARAYFDINCAHCHSDGGFCQFQSTLRFSYEIPFEDSQIYERRNSIDDRMMTYSPFYSMPLIGTTMVHDEGYTLIRAYLNSL